MPLRAALLTALLGTCLVGPAAGQCEQQLLTGADRFGAALSRSGERLAVADGAGGVQVLRLAADGWRVEASLTSPGGDDGFGHAVALADPWLFVAAPDHDAAGAEDSGRVHVFRRRGAQWQADTPLDAPLPSPGADFGTALASDGARLLVGTPGDDSQGRDRGAVIVHERVAGAWQVISELTEDGATATRFGSAIALDGDRALVGADDPATSGAWVFEADVEGNWAQTVRIDGGDLLGGPPGAGFGGAVALAGDVLAVGAPGHVHAGGPAGNVGAVYVFRFDELEGEWFQEAELLGGAITPAGVHDPGAADPHAARPQLAFGAALALSTSTRELLVGAPGGPLGSVHGFVENDLAWTPTARLFGQPGAPLPDTPARFGQALALRGRELLVGAPDGQRVHAWQGTWGRPGWTGLGGDSTPDGTRACLTARSTPPHDVATLQLEGLAPGAAAWLVFGVQTVEQLVGGGLLVPAPQALVPLVADDSGRWTGALRVPAVGALWLQAWAPAASGWQVSNALQHVATP